MRKITIESVEAFTSCGNLYKDNTEVKTYSDTIAKMFLFWNHIAELYNNQKILYISNCGYYTNTTKERLNWILDHYKLGSIKQKAWVWYLNWEEFTWELTFNLK